MGVPIVLHHVTKRPHTHFPHFASFPNELPDYLFMVLFFTAPSQYHDPSISSTISLPICKFPFISFTSYRNLPMGPLPSTSFPSTLHPTRANHITLGHLFLYLYTFPKKKYSLFIVQTPLFPFITLPFLSSPLATCFPFFGQTQPMSPLVGALLIIYPRRHCPYLQSTPQVTYLYPLNLFTLSRLWHNLSPVLSSP
jgi:hypothetical protein